MRGMTVLVLDARWPQMVPVDVAQRLVGPLAFTAEVPVSVRWSLSAPSTVGEPWLVTTDPADPEVRERAAAGEDVVRVPSLEDPIVEARRVMRDARRRGEWERQMTHVSLLPFLREESAELAEAIEQGAGDEALKHELADVLLQVLFHAEIADERGAFDFGDVAAAFVAKMRSRAPYFFDGSTGLVDQATQDRLWAEGKAREAD